MNISLSNWSLNYRAWLSESAENKNLFIFMVLSKQEAFDWKDTVSFIFLTLPVPAELIKCSRNSVSLAGYENILGRFLLGILAGGMRSTIYFAFERAEHEKNSYELEFCPP